MDPTTHPAQFSCAVGQWGTSWEIRVEGEVDMAGVPELEEAAAGVRLEPSGILTVDLTSTTFVDSSGIRWLLELQRRVDGHAGMLVVLVSSGPVLDVLRLTGILDHIAVIST